MLGAMAAQVQIIVGNHSPMYVTSGVVTSVQKNWEGAGHIGGDQHAVIKWGILVIAQSP